VPPIPVRELTSSFQARYTNTGRSLHTDFSAGMMRDVPSWQSPDGACWDAADMLCDYPTKIRKRGGSTSPASGNSAATVENLLAYKSGAIDGITGVWGSLGKSGITIISFNTSTGAATTVVTGGSVNTIACRPFQYLNLMVFSFQGTGYTTNDQNVTRIGGGGTAANASDIAGTVTAGDNRITGMTANPLVAGHLGAMIRATKAGNVYNGRAWRSVLGFRRSR
jgi:hypothetical protein